jgi:uncharacterized protein (TIGR00290 family)
VRVRRCPATVSRRTRRARRPAFAQLGPSRKGKGHDRASPIRIALLQEVAPLTFGKRDAVLCSWSSGKDSAFALEIALQTGVNVVGLLCTVNVAADRVAMHAVRRGLLEAQADRLRLPISTVDIPADCSHDEYASLMEQALRRASVDGIRGMIFGDLFLEDVRQYRIDVLRGTGIEPIFPLWRRETSGLAREMITRNVRAVVTCVDPMKLDPSFVGRSFDQQFIADLPPDSDPCGENGEFHTFVWDAPSFHSPIAVQNGIVVQRDGFVFADVVPR